MTKSTFTDRLTVTSAAMLLGVLALNVQAAPRDVQFKTIDFEMSVIELQNFGDTGQSLSRWQFCSHDDNQTRQYSLPNALNSMTLNAGESLFLHFDNDAPGGAIDALNISSLGPFAVPLDRGPYSIGLYTNSSFGSPASLVDHVQWSIDGVDNTIADERSLVAQNAGLWTNQSQWVETTPTTQRLELILDGLGDPPAGTHGPTSYAVVEPPPLSPADIDEDNDVDGDDLAFWTAAFGADAGGDIDADGDTDGADFLIWQQEFTGPLGSIAATAVPEPSSVGLIGLATLLLYTRRRHR